MTIAGHGGTDIIRQVASNVVQALKKKRPVCTAPCDGLILKMHYQWSFWFFLAGFSTYWYSWYTRDPITCVSKFDAGAQVRFDYLNACHSYLYIDLGDGGKRFLLFYRWIHWALLALAFCFYMPRKFSKNSENPRLKKLIEDLATHSSRYDQAEKELVEKAAKFIALNWNTHNGLFFKYVGCNLIALFVDICSFFFLDFLLQGRFIHYGWMAFPYHRDPLHFTDYMSTTFPQFAVCKITREYMLTNKREEAFGCHLTIMELYDKVFLVIWFWLIILTIATCGYLIFLAFLSLPYFRLMILRVSKPIFAEKSVRDVISAVISVQISDNERMSETNQKGLKTCKIGDVYLLYRMKQHLSDARFYDLLSRITEILSKDQCASMDSLTLGRNQENLRPRKNNSKMPPMMYNPHEYYNPNINRLSE